jgi:tetratricopeptide (TPR) repeat protein
MSPEQITEEAIDSAHRLIRAGRHQVALNVLLDALDADPLCREVLVDVGDLLTHRFEELGLEEQPALLRAIEFYDRAIAAQPDHAGAYAEKALALLYLEQNDAALACAEQGMALFDDPPTTDLCHDVWVNVGESLYRRKALALLELGRAAEGRRVLDEGLTRFPGSRYLTWATKHFLPEL